MSTSLHGLRLKVWDDELAGCLHTLCGEGTAGPQAQSPAQSMTEQGITWMQGCRSLCDCFDPFYFSTDSATKQQAGLGTWLPQAGECTETTLLCVHQLLPQCM